ncbi:MAG: hypothetical protein H6934_08625 [Burkholderiaceae bacterium]|nr:hypothetical protein [Burkholderiaceae bacterium]
MSKKASPTDWMDSGLMPTTLSEAERQLERERAAPAARPRPSAETFDQHQLSRRALAVIETLPPGFRLHETRLQFPRVLERLAAVWHDPIEFRRTFDDLIMDDRGGRQGFPFEVVNELTDLQEYYFNEVHPRPQNPFR